MLYLGSLLTSQSMRLLFNFDSKFEIDIVIEFWELIIEKDD
jgi:hypothetical protein